MTTAFRILAFSTMCGAAGSMGCGDDGLEPPIDGGFVGADSAIDGAADPVSDARTIDADRVDGSIAISDGLLHFDDFEYDVPRDAEGAGAVFIDHGWAGAKTIQDGADGSRGYVYTTDTIPGYTGVLPGRDSGRVLVLEALPATLTGQTDFYLQWGSGDGAIGQIPANHWFQFWVFSPAAPEQNLFTQGKFIYPNRASFYPATLANEGYVYLSSLGKLSGQTLALDCDPDRAVGCEQAYYQTGWNNAAGLTNRQPDGSSSFDQNLSEAAPIVAGQWTLVRLHVDVSGTDSRAAPGHAVHEQWIRRLGETDWTKTTEWVGGVTMNPSASSSEPVDLRPAFTDGFRTIRMPTTVGGTNAAIGDWYDYRLYIDDFALAAAEEDLPVYP